MDITSKYIKSICQDFQSLRYEASKFVDEREKVKHTGHTYRCTSNEDEISFDVWNGEVIWKYRYNVACHCHPEIQTVENKYSIDDFVKWAKENGITIEPYEENE